MQAGDADYICLNYANCDMVGHTGVPKAIIKACETVDSCVERVVKTGLDNDYAFVIIADHGNSDNMLNSRRKSEYGTLNESSAMYCDR